MLLYYALENQEPAFHEKFLESTTKPKPAEFLFARSAAVKTLLNQSAA